MWWLDHVGARVTCPLVNRVDGVGVAGGHVDRVGARSHLAMNAIDVLGRTEDDCAAGRPAQLCMNHLARAVGYGQRLAEAQNFDKEAQRFPGVVVVQDWAVSNGPASNGQLRAVSHVAERRRLRSRSMAPPGRPTDNR